MRFMSIPCFGISRKRIIRIRSFLQVSLILMERRAETTEEVVYSWHDKGEVPQTANCGFKFLGGGSFIREELTDICCPGNTFIFREGDYQSSKVEVPTKDDLRFRGSRLCFEFVPRVHALMGRGFLWMIRARGCIHCKESGALCASDMVGAWDVDSQVDDVIYVDVMRPLWVDGDVTMPEGD